MTKWVCESQAQIECAYIRESINTLNGVRVAPSLSVIYLPWFECKQTSHVIYDHQNDEQTHTNTSSVVAVNSQIAWLPF